MDEAEKETFETDAFRMRLKGQLNWIFHFFYVGHELSGILYDPP